MIAALRTSTRLFALAFTLAASTLLAACDKPLAMGNRNQILIVAPQEVWNTLQAPITEALEPTTFTVRDERVFEIAHIDPEEGGWGNSRVLRQMLLIGSAEQPYIAEAIEAHRGDVPAPPSLFQVRGLWAQEQMVTVLLLPGPGQTEGVEPLMPAIGGTFLNQFEDYARSRMFVTRPNEELRDSLVRHGGFALTLPRVYRSAILEENVFQFRNDQPDPADLIRNVTVAWRTAGEVEFTAEAAHAWRAELAERHTQPPQVTEPTPESHPLETGDRRALQTHGIWSNPPGGWPSAGPYITRLVECPGRIYLIDAWLYAPGVPKYEYMFQLNTIIDSFECATAG